MRAPRQFPVIVEKPDQAEPDRDAAARSRHRGCVRSAHSSVETVSASRIRKPPIVGVPFLRTRWLCGPSVANRLAFALHRFEPGDQLRPEDEADQQRGDDRPAGAEGDVAEDVEAPETGRRSGTEADKAFGSCFGQRRGRQQPLGDGGRRQPDGLSHNDIGGEATTRPRTRSCRRRWRASASRATAASSNGSTSRPMICPVSWPLPAITSTSPVRSSPIAAPIAWRRSPISTAPGAAARIARRISAGSSLRGLSSVT